ncbi:MAG: efflux RND transporter periplasmic adaptor subunit [Acidisphaera sp.]|nr:efflux RND transporter periplasmic adaptor subunit [Acidisphaera sp.]
MNEILVEPRTRPSVREAPIRTVTRRRAVAGLLALLVLAVIVYAVVRPAATPTGRARNGAGQPIPVLVAAAQQQDVPIYLDGLGTVVAYNTVTVRPMIDGPLTEVDFREGQDVRVGDVLARIDPRPYQATLDQAVAKKAQDEASLANAKLDLARYVKLAATAYTSAQTADTQRATVAQDEAQVKQDQASIDSARTQLSYTTIVAPINGRTGIRQVDVGNIVHTTDSNGLVVIATLQPISVIFTLPQQDLPQVTAAMQAAKPEVLAMPQGDPQGDAQDATARVLDTGRLEVVDNQVDPATGTIKLKATFPNPKLALWPGGFIDVRLHVRTERNAITVPPVAIQRGPAGDYVYVLDAGDTVSRRTVTVGHEDLQASIVTDGLKPSEQVVVDGASRLTDKAHVTVGDQNATPGTAPTAEQHRRTPESATRQGRHRPGAS